jgi:hypothetical protein
MLIQNRCRKVLFMGRRDILLTGSILLLLIIFTSLNTTFPVIANNPGQIPTGSVPTVTGTVTGPMVTVLPGKEDQVNVRGGPGVFYPKVGVLLVGQQVPAKGRSPGGDWIVVGYPGIAGGTAWVYAPYVRIIPATELPIVAPPPTPTPQYTPTIDPTLAAQFVITVIPSRLPTFTAPPPLLIPTYESPTPNVVNRIPAGMIIVGLAVIGTLLGLVSFSQR